MATLITGGTGRLGSVLKKHIDCVAPTRDELDITDPKSCYRAIKKYQPDLIIHCAGYVNTLKAEENKKECWNVNVNGTANLFKYSFNTKFVYISTDYVFDGENAPYDEDSIPNPINFYGLTKLIGEQIVLQYPLSLVLRAPFRTSGPWPYERAFEDQWTSCRFVEDVVKDIIKLSQSDIEGIVHLPGERMSILEMARLVSPEVKAMRRSEVSVKLPRDVALISKMCYN